MGGSDCEVLREGWLAQPVNAWSSAAFLVAGAYLIARCRRVPPIARAPLIAGGVALALVAVGSAAFHGPQPSWADAAHDGSIAALLMVFVARGSGFTRRTVAACAGMLAAALVVLTVNPGAEAIVHGLLAAAAATVELQRLRAGTTSRSFGVTAAVAFGAGVVLLVLGRTGGLLCAPASLVQAHAGWHVLSAVAAGALLAAEVRPMTTTATTLR